MRWGWVYYPSVCLTEACKFAFILHGCDGHAHSGVMSWGQMAANNKLALVFPQSAQCWDHLKPARSNGTFSNQGFSEIFFSKILDRVTSPVSDVYNNEGENETEDVYEMQVSATGIEELS